MKPRILIVEDESLIAMLLEDILTDAGYIADATATNVEQAMSMIEAGSFDAAILDVNLGGSASFPAAEILRSRGVPILFTTGYGEQGLPAAYTSIPVLLKPFRKSDIEAALRSLLGKPSATR
ncbi:response regulator [Pseudoxanthomonas sp. LARHCG66]|jgi:DNA-binding response OmpR family regulator